MAELVSQPRSRGLEIRAFDPAIAVEVERLKPSG
jgi:hypothetical protein